MRRCWRRRRGRSGKHHQDGYSRIIITHRENAVSIIAPTPGQEKEFYLTLRGIVSLTPKIVRSMREEVGKPLLGPRDLGVRTPPDLYADITPDAADEVQPGTGGMFVAPDLRDLPARLVPRRLRHLVPTVAGNDDRFIWALGEGAFVEGRVASGLTLRPDPERAGHGFVEPERSMTLTDCAAALDATRDDWRFNEA